MDKIKVSLYLDEYILEVLKAFGDLNTVVNKILECTSQTVDIGSLPVAPASKECKRVEVVIEEPTYLSYIQTMGRKSKKLSLKRLIYWFVNNEQYNDYGFEPVETVDTRKNKYYIRVSEFLNFVNLLEKYYCDSSVCDKVRESLHLVMEELQ